MSRLATQVSTARSRSASARIRYGSLPPSSSTVFLSTAPAFAATARPAGVLPVSVTAATAGLLDQAGDAARSRPAACGRAPAGARARRSTSSIARAQPVTFEACFEQRAVARHERRRREAEHLPEGEVPRHHREHDAERLEADEAPRGLGGDGLARRGRPARARRSSRRRRRTSRPRRAPARGACPSRGPSAGRAPRSRSRSRRAAARSGRARSAKPRRAHARCAAGAGGQHGVPAARRVPSGA